MERIFSKVRTPDRDRQVISFQGEFEFITLTSRNRLQFLRLLEKSFALGLGDETLGIADFHSLVGETHDFSR